MAHASVSESATSGESHPAVCSPRDDVAQLAVLYAERRLFRRHRHRRVPAAALRASSALLEAIAMQSARTMSDYSYLARKYNLPAASATRDAPYLRKGTAQKRISYSSPRTMLRESRRLIAASDGNKIPAPAFSPVEPHMPSFTRVHGLPLPSARRTNKLQPLAEHTTQETAPLECVIQSPSPPNVIRFSPAP